eukprot:COSAG02_NODE_29320_length_571_cov_1.298729_2_plen_87_part_01
MQVAPQHRQEQAREEEEMQLLPPTSRHRSVRRKPPLAPKKFMGLLNTRGEQVLLAVVFITPAALAAVLANINTGAIVAGITMVLYIL